MRREGDLVRAARHGSVCVAREATAREVPDDEDQDWDDNDTARQRDSGWAAPTGVGRGRAPVAGIRRALAVFK